MKHRRYARRITWRDHLVAWWTVEGHEWTEAIGGAILLGLFTVILIADLWLTTVLLGR